MPSMTARRKCPELIFVSPRFDVYRAVSHQIHGIFARYTPIIEPLSLDEAYLDITHPLVDRGSATKIAEEIKAAIRAEARLTASVGVSYNKFLAKIASDYRKPDGLYIITPEMGPVFVEKLPIERFHGVGPVTAARMNALGIRTGLDLRRQTRAFLVGHFGKTGDFYYSMARGEDDRPVMPDRGPKSIGVERTFERDLTHWNEVGPVLEPMLTELWDLYSKSGAAGRTVTVKIRFADFRRMTRSRSLSEPIVSRQVLDEISSELLHAQFPPLLPIRLLGVTLSNFASASQHRDAQLLLPFF